MSRCTLPFTRAQADALYNRDTGYFDVGLQFVEGDNPRAFKDPLEALIAMSGFDIMGVITALSRAVHKANNQRHAMPYVSLRLAADAALEDIRRNVYGFYYVEWQFLNVDPAAFKDWELLIEMKRIAWTGKAVIRIKGRDLEAIEKGEHTRNDLNRDLLRG